jgi:hypothetical protein
MRKISTYHKHYNNFCRIYIETVLKFIQFVRNLEGIYVGINIRKVLNFKNFRKMLVIIGPHFLNTLHARAIGMIWYCDDVMGVISAPPGPEPPFPILLAWESKYIFT